MLISAGWVNAAISELSDYFRKEFMRSRALAIFDSRNLWLFLPTLLMFLYGMQGVAGVLIFRDQVASQFVVLLIIGLLAYVLTYLSLRRYLPVIPCLERITDTYRLSGDGWIKAISAVYFLLMIYAVISSKKIALWEAINGASSADIAHAREALFKARAGWELSLVYLNALFSSALMPYVLVVCYLEKKSYRHILLSLFVISLLPSLEKALVIKAFLPLIIAAFSGYLPRRSGYLFIVLMLSIILGTTQLTKIGQRDPVLQILQAQQSRQVVGVELAQSIQQALQALQALQSQQSQKVELDKLIQQAQKNLKDLQAEQAFQAKNLSKYQPFGHGNQGQFLMNRVFWIPYITAYDWLGYFHEKMHDEYLLGRTSLVVSALTGQCQYPMEKEVFVYQFGAGGPPTATANANFLMDAFVNFGWIGVALFAALFAALTRSVELIDNSAAKACYYYFAYQVAVGGLLAVLFGNGMLIFIVLALFTKPKIISNEK